MLPWSLVRSFFTAGDLEAIDAELDPYVPALQRRLYAELTYLR